MTVTFKLLLATLLLCASPVHASVTLDPSPPPYDPETYGYYEEEPAPVGVEPPEGSSDLGASEDPE